MNYVILHSRIKKNILYLWVVFAVVIALYAAFIWMEFTNFFKVFSSVQISFFVLYDMLLIMITIVVAALAYGYGYKKGLRQGKDVTQG